MYYSLLCDQNYFFRRDKHEQDKRKEKEHKRLQLKQLASAQQAAAAASNIYANTYVNHQQPTGYGLPSTAVMATPAFGAGYAFSTQTATTTANNGSGFGSTSSSSSSSYVATGDVGLPWQAAVSSHGTSSCLPPASALASASASASFSSSIPPAYVAPSIDQAVKAESVPQEVTTEAVANKEVDVEEEEEEDAALGPDIDEKQMAYCTMEGVKLLSQPPILKAELHEHQVKKKILMDL